MSNQNQTGQPKLSSEEISKAFSMKVPKIGLLSAESAKSLAYKFAEARDAGGYGASDIGSRWPVLDAQGKHTASVSYNGRITWEVA